MDAKTQLRKRLLAELKNVYEKDIDTLEIKVNELNRNISGFISSRHPIDSTQTRYWGSYMNLKNEPAHRPTQDLGVVWVYPRINHNQMDYYQANHFEKSKFGFMEPSLSSTEISMSQIHGVLVPGLAFTKEGVRLGRGKGFFDQSLKNWHGIKVGVCLQEQVMESLPQDSWDINMDYVITDKEIVNCKK